MTDFRRIDPAAIDFSQARLAQKVARVRARPAEPGERVATVMKDGHVETENVAAAGDLVVTNPSGEQYLVKAATFAERYQPTATPGEFAPKAAPVKALVITENVAFTAPWGETMRIKAGGVLISENGEVRGVQAEEFAETYRYLD
jgi:hypothetical protein